MLNDCILLIYDKILYLLYRLIFGVSLSVGFIDMYLIFLFRDCFD